MKIKRMIAVVTAFVLVGGAYPFTATSSAIGNVFAEDTEATAEVVKDGIKYTITDEKAVVSGLDDETIADVVIPDEVDGCPVVEIGKNAFWYSSIKSITLGKNVLMINTNAFVSCVELEKVILNDELISIENRAFEKCFNLIEIKTGSNLKSIGDDAFIMCFNLRSFEIGDNISDIGEGAFQRTSIEVFNVPERFTEIKNVFRNRSAYKNYDGIIIIKNPMCELIYPDSGWENVLIVCDDDSKAKVQAAKSGLKTCNFEQYENGEYEKNEISPIDPCTCGRDYGMAFEEVEDGLRVKSVCWVKDGTLVIPDEVGGIPVVEFFPYTPENDMIKVNTHIAEKVKKVVLGKNVKRLSQETFADMTNLEEVECDENLEVIGKGAFKHLSKLKKVKLNEGLKEIGIWAFYRCKSLEEVELPSTLEVIEGHAFEDTGLSYIVIPESVEEVLPDAFLFPNKEDDREITVKVLNPDCKFGTEQFKECFYNVDKLFGYAGSTAYEYANEKMYFSGEFYAFGDANCDYELDMSDIVLIMQSLANPNKYGPEGTDEHHITEKGIECADVDNSGNGITANDALKIQKYLLGQEKLV